MGSTYSVEKQAAALVAPNGVIFFALFERTYESNVFPQTPHWCARYFGTAEACMARIIASAIDCEGGMLKEAGGGYTTPSAYIKHWREALANPSTMRKSVVSAEFGNGIYVISDDKRTAIEAILAKHGHPGIVDNKVTIDLGKQPELLQEIIDARTSAWKFIDRSNVRHESAKDWAAYPPPLCEGDVPEVSVFYIQESNHDREHWVLMDGQMHGLGWSYSTIGRLIERFGPPSEKARPGSVESVIRAIRAAVKKAVPFPKEQRVRIDGSKAEDSYRTSAFESFAAKLGMEGVKAVETTVRDILAADALYGFCSMTRDMVTFLDHPAGPPAPVQQDLLAA